nr:spore coat U domain-containing protein [uncultured Lichenicoccus sp.]
MNSYRKRLPTNARVLVGLASCLLLTPLVASPPASAGTATTTLPVSITITAGCTVTATAVAFATQSTLGAAIAANGTVSPTCTNTTPYVVSLDKGGGAGATTTLRKMTGPASAVITYSLFQNASLTTNFGNTSGTDTVSGTGNGTAQPITVYGQVPAQTSPAPGAYADVVNVTVTF